MYRDPGIEGWMSGPDLEWLYQTAKRMQSVVEVGSWKGRSTHALLSGSLAGRNGLVYAVDHWQGSAHELDTFQREARERDVFWDFWRNVGGSPNLRVVRRASLEAVAYVPKVDMLFLDGAHTYEEVKADLRAWMPKATRIISGHDYDSIPDHAGVRRAVDELVGKVSVVDHIWYHELGGG